MAVDKTVLKVLNKLFEKGYVTEKSIANFSLDDVKIIEFYSPSEIVTVIALRDAVKANKVISCLSGYQEQEQ